MPSDEVGDTWVDPSGWGKGVLLVENAAGEQNHLGRYWPSTGPQVTLYVPAPFLSAGTNQLCLFELEQSPCPPSPCQVSLVDQPILDGPVSASARVNSAEQRKRSARRKYSL